MLISLTVGLEEAAPLADLVEVVERHLICVNRPRAKRMEFLEGIMGGGGGIGSAGGSGGSGRGIMMYDCTGVAISTAASRATFLRALARDIFACDEGVGSDSIE